MADRLVPQLPSPLERGIDSFNDVACLFAKVVAVATFCLDVPSFLGGVSTSALHFDSERCAHAVQAALCIFGLGAPEPLGVASGKINIGISEALKKVGVTISKIDRAPAAEWGGRYLLMDKTGTITENKMTATRAWMAGAVYEATGSGYHIDGILRADEQQPLFRVFASALVTCNSATVREGDIKLGTPTDAAGLVLGLKMGGRADSVVAVWPFSSEVKCSAVLLDTGIIIYKGAAAAMSEKCSHYLNDGVTRPPGFRTDEEKRTMLDAISDGRGLRTLVYAQKDTNQTKKGAMYEEILPITKDSSADEKNRFFRSHFSELVMIGAIGIEDPLAKDITKAIGELALAGLCFGIISGDAPPTVLAAAEAAGMEVDERDVLNNERNHEVERMLANDAAEMKVWLRQRLGRPLLFCRTLPDQKGAIVRAFQDLGENVAYIGDGANDTTAISWANVGFSFAHGNLAARSKADFVLDKFSDILKCMFEARGGVDTIQNMAPLLVACNFALVCAYFVCKWRYGSSFGMVSLL